MGDLPGLWIDPAYSQGYAFSKFRTEILKTIFILILILIQVNMISMRSCGANQNLRRSSRFRKSAVQYCKTIDEEAFEEQKVGEDWCVRVRVKSLRCLRLISFIDDIYDAVVVIV